MRTKIIEATNGPRNWGKFLVGKFEQEEWVKRSKVDDNFLLKGRGWTHEHYLVLDLQTGEGAIFRHGGNARADLNKRKIWVCPLFEPFLEWLYKQNGPLPDFVDLPEAPFELRGYRRPGRR